MAIDQETIRLAKILWNYHLLHQDSKKSDCILVMGSHDVKVAERGAELFLQGWAPYLLFSGGRGRLTDKWEEPEAEVFSKVAIKVGVPEDRIIKETHATNTQENVLFSKELLSKLGHKDFNKFIIVQKPYMERRALATFQKNWPEAEAVVTSPEISFEENAEYRGIEKLINIVVGDTLRLKLYGKEGYLVPQEIPEDVDRAYKKLADLGYNEYVIPE